MLSSLVISLPKTVQFIGGHDVNANVGVQKIMHKKVIRIYGIESCNKKRRNLLILFGANNLRMVNIFFKKRNYTTYTSFNKFKTPHMLDVTTCSTSFFKCVSDCGATPDGVRSYPSAIQMVFLNRSIKFKSDFIERPVIEWKNIKNIRIKW